MSKVYLLGKTVPTDGSKDVEKMAVTAGRSDYYQESFLDFYKDLDKEKSAITIETLKQYRASLYYDILKFVNFIFGISNLDEKTIKKIKLMFKNIIINKDEVLISANAYELNDFFSVACCSKLGIEVNNLADQMLDICLAEAPNLFKDAGAPCTFDKCNKGISCGEKRQAKIKQIIKTY